MQFDCWLHVYILAIYFMLLSVSFIGPHLGFSRPVLSTADLRSAVGSKVEIPAKVPISLHDQDGTKDSVVSYGRLLAAGCSMHPFAAQSVTDLVSYALFRALFLSWDFILPIAPTLTFLNATATFVICV